MKLTLCFKNEVGNPYRDADGKFASKDNSVPTISKSLKARAALFLTDDRVKSQWLEVKGKDGKLKAYLRKDRFAVKGLTNKVEPFINIANVIFDKELRGKGIFDDLLQSLEKKGNVAVESIMNESLKKHLEKKGYTLIQQNEGKTEGAYYNAYKIKKGENTMSLLRELTAIYRVKKQERELIEKANPYRMNNGKFGTKDKHDFVVGQAADFEKEVAAAKKVRGEKAKAARAITAENKEKAKQYEGLSSKEKSEVLRQIEKERGKRLSQREIIRTFEPNKYKDYVKQQKELKAALKEATQSKGKKLTAQEIIDVRESLKK